MAAPVVVVHNDSPLRELLLFTLRTAGHDVAGFEDPMAALAAIEADPGVRVVVTRVNFGSGKLNGVAFARMLRLKRPQLKTVFVGRPENAQHTDGLGEFLPLPLNADHLAHIVASLLAEHRLGCALSSAVEQLPPAGGRQQREGWNWMAETSSLIASDGAPAPAQAGLNTCPVTRPSK